MYIALSIFLAAAGAILRYAIVDHVKDVNLDKIGMILIIVGVVGFVVAVIAEVVQRTRHTRRTVDRPDDGSVREDIRES